MQFLFWQKKEMSGLYWLLMLHTDVPGDIHNSSNEG
jgi:hypothetical protein